METTTTKSVVTKLNLNFRNLAYSIQNGKKKRKEEKRLLDTEVEREIDKGNAPRWKADPLKREQAERKEIEEEPTSINDMLENLTTIPTMSKLKLKNLLLFINQSLNV